VVQLGEDLAVDHGQDSTFEGHHVTCPAYWYTDGNLLHVRVVMKAVGSMTCDVNAWVVVPGAVTIVLE